MNFMINFKWEDIINSRIKGGEKFSYGRDYKEILPLIAPQLDLSEFQFHTDEEKYNFINSLFYNLKPDSELADKIGLKDFELYDYKPDNK